MQSTTMSSPEFSEINVYQLAYFGELDNKAIFFQNHPLCCLGFIGFTFGF